MGVIFANGFGVGTVPNNTSGWIRVSSNGTDGTISQTGQTIFNIVGPNNNNGAEFLYVKKQFQTAGTLNISYHWTNNDSDGAGNDWPIYEVTSTEPTGILGTYLTSQLSDTNSVDETSTWSISYNAGDWVAIGLYSTDSCCGFGTLDFNITNDLAGQWYLGTGAFGYQPAWTFGIVSWPMNAGNYGSSYGTDNPNEILVNDSAGVYISLIDSLGNLHYELISALVGRTGTITFTQGSKNVTFGFTSNTFADGTSIFGSIFWSPSGGPFGTLGPLTLISSSNTTFTGYSDGDINMSGGPLTYNNSGIAPNNSQLVTITYTTDAPSFTLTSDMFDTNQSSGSICNNPQGHWNGFSGFTVSQSANLGCGVTAHLSGTTQIHNAYVAAGATESYPGFICDVVWGNGSTVTHGIAKIAYIPNSGNQINITTVDPTDTNYLNNDNNAVGTSLVGTFNFPATFTFRTPLDVKGGWC